MTQREKRAWNAAKNRRELIEAGFSRRDLAKMGLLIGAGYLVLKCGLSARADGKIESPPTGAFIEPLSIMPTKQAVASLTPAPTIGPHTPARDGRTSCNQACRP